LATSPYKSPSYVLPEALTGSVINKLLAEYSEKLNKVMERFTMIKSRKYLWLAIYGSIYLGCLIVDFFVLKTKFFGISALGSTALGLLPIYLFLSIWESRRRVFVKYEIRALSSQLKRLVDRASSIEDHGELNFENRFELELRMNDAERALRAAEFILGRMSSL